MWTDTALSAINERVIKREFFKILCDKVLWSG